VQNHSGNSLGEDANLISDFVIHRPVEYFCRNANPPGIL
jgi:hypothetical protein